VHDGRRIVAEARNDGDVGLAGLELHRKVVDLGDGAIGGLVGLGIDKRAHAARHRIAFRRLVAPAVEVIDHVIGVEVIAVRPLHALAHVKRVFCGVVIDVPALNKLAGECGVAVIAHEVFIGLTRDIGHFRPVPGAGVLHFLDDHLHLEDAALLGLTLSAGRRVGQAEHAIGRCRGGAEHAGHGQEFTAIEPAGLGVSSQAFNHFRQRFAVLPKKLHLDFLHCLFGHLLAVLVIIGLF